MRYSVKRLISLLSLIIILITMHCCTSAAIADVTEAQADEGALCGCRMVSWRNPDDPCDCEYLQDCYRYRCTEACCGFIPNPDDAFAWYMQLSVSDWTGSSAAELANAFSVQPLQAYSFQQTHSMKIPGDNKPVSVTMEYFIVGDRGRKHGVYQFSIHSDDYLIKPIQCLDPYAPFFAPLEMCSMPTLYCDGQIPELGWDSGNWQLLDDGHTLRFGYLSMGRWQQGHPLPYDYDIHSGLVLDVTIQWMQDNELKKICESIPFAVTLIKETEN